MKNRSKRGAPSMIVCVCLALVGCANASAKTSNRDVRPETSTKALGKPLTNDERDRFVQKLAPRLSRSTKGLEEKRAPRGSHRIDLAGRFNHLQVAVRGVDGKIQQSCVTTPDELLQLLQQKQSRDTEVSRRQP